VATKVKEISRKLDGFIDVTTRGLLNVNFLNAEQVNNASTSSTYNSQIVKASNAVVLENCPQDIKDPHDLKQFIDNICKEASNDITGQK
jgi:hypothetical protein